MASRTAVRRGWQGSERAFDGLMNRHSWRMRKMTFSILRDLEEAADELQNASWKTWQQLDRFEVNCVSPRG
jgi:DNA-directed RNA polymerase specialized sigma24 family protein